MANVWVGSSRNRVANGWADGFPYKREQVVQVKVPPCSSTAGRALPEDCPPQRDLFLATSRVFFNSRLFPKRKIPGPGESYP